MVNTNSDETTKSTNEPLYDIFNAHVTNGAFTQVNVVPITYKAAQSTYKIA